MTPKFHSFFAIRFPCKISHLLCRYVATQNGLKVRSLCLVALYTVLGLGLGLHIHGKSEDFVLLTFDIYYLPSEDEINIIINFQIHEGTHASFFLNSVVQLSLCVILVLTGTRSTCGTCASPKNVSVRASLQPHCLSPNHHNYSFATTMASKNTSFNLQTCARPNILALEPYRCAREYVSLSKFGYSRVTGL